MKEKGKIVDSTAGPTIGHLLDKPLFSFNGTARGHKNIIKSLLKKGVICKEGIGLYCYGDFVKKLMDEFDLAFKNLCMKFKAEEHIYPSIVNTEVLEKAGYFRNFSDLVEFIPNKKNRKFTFLPAACLPCYSQLSGRNLKIGLTAITTRNTIFRNENAYENIFKMKRFDMRELVFVGSKDRVKKSLGMVTEEIKRFCRDINIDFTLNYSTDTFYGGYPDIKSLFQLLAESKLELRAYSHDTGSFIPVSSINYHGGRFGKAFNIRVKNEFAHSGCAAFGIQRWALIFLNTHGLNKKNWPNIKHNF